MDLVAHIAVTIVAQLQSPTLAFLIGGMILAAAGSKLMVPEPVCEFIVLLLLLKVGISAGMSIREANLVELAVPALGATILGIAIVALGGVTLARMRGVAWMDAMATVGLFGAVSASTPAAGMAMLDDADVAHEGFIGALCPFMDIAALVSAIVLARLAAERMQAAALQDGTATMTPRGGGTGPVDPGPVRGIMIDTVRSAAISALLLGLGLGLLARPGSVHASFYDPLFRGLLPILILIMGMEAWARLTGLRKVAHAHVLYGVTAPFVHGLTGFGVGLLAHHITGFSAGGAVLLAVMAASSSDISGPPTLRAALPEANPSAHVGTSTGIGTPVAILSIPIWMALADAVIGF